MTVSHSIAVGDWRFAIPTEDVDATQEAILTAVHGGGGYVTFHPGPEHRVDILITPSTSVQSHHQDAVADLELVHDPVIDEFDQGWG